MSTQAVSLPAAPPSPAEVAVRRTRSCGKTSAKLQRLPGPEALLHPGATEALLLAFRPLSRDR